MAHGGAVLRRWPVLLYPLSAFLILAACGGSTASPTPKIAHDDLTVDFGDFQARAQVTYPASGAGPFPAVVLIPGGGPLDMDVTITGAAGNLRSHVFLDLANFLSSNGYAVVRYNKHYVTGPNDQANQALVRTYETKVPQKQLLADADTVYQTAKANPKIDPKRVVFFGISEGTPVATQLALMHAEAAGLILASPISGSWKENLQYQLLDVAVGYLRDVADANKDGVLTMAEFQQALQHGDDGAAAENASRIVLDPQSTPTMPMFNAAIDRNHDGQIDIAGELAPFYRSFFADFDRYTQSGPFSAFAPDKVLPTIVASVPNVKGPVLVLQGAHDASVDPAGAQQIADALATAGNADHTLISYPDLGHLLGTADSINQDAFQPIAAPPLHDLTAWLDRRVKT